MFCREHKIWAETQTANLDEIMEYEQLKVIQDLFLLLHFDRNGLG